MKKIALFALLLITAHIAQAAKSEFVPYYMKNANSANSNVIKTDQANCGKDDCGGDCNGGTSNDILTTAQYISLQVKADNYAKQNSCGGCGNDNCGDDSIDLPIK